MQRMKVVKSKNDNHIINNQKLGRSNLNRSLKSSTTIRFKLIASFMVPIVFIIILGLVSFKVASDGIVKNYKKSALQSINMTSEYLGLELMSVDATGVQYSSDETMSKYFSNFYKNDMYGFNNASKYISRTLSAKQILDKFIDNIYIISDNVKSISTNGSFDSGLFEGFAQTEQGSFLKEKSTNNTWFGINEYLDQKLGTSSKDYSIRMIRKLSGAKAMIIIDVKTDTVKDVISRLDFDKSGYIAVVTSDGKEVTTEKDLENNVNDRNGNKSIFTGKEFYQKAVNSEATSGYEYVNFNNKSYLFMYSKIGETGAMICALMPKDVITSQADNIKKITIMIVIIATVLATATAIMISQGIDKAIKGIIVQLKKASKGDLTIEFKLRRRDEFQILIEEIQSTFLNMKNLIKYLNELSAEVSLTSANVSKSSDIFFKSTKDISVAMDEIEQGISQQAKDAEECLNQMDNLSQRIVLVSDNAKEITQIADNTKSNIKEGTKVTEDLSNQTKSTIEITTDVINNIEKLDEKSVSINKIVNVINEIASQTNLLSLNASIEAARAGEYGKGFAVVASEIRNLAEQSQGSVSDIKNMIRSLQEDTKKVAGTAKVAAKVLMLQDSAVKKTISSYSDINDSVEKLMICLKYITHNVENIEDSRISTLGAIENISAVLEEILASTNTVNQTSNEQLDFVDTLNKEAGILNHNTEILVNEVKKFKVE